MREILKFVDVRLREPSTWAGIAVLLGMLHVSVDPGLWQVMTLWGSAIAAGLAILLSELGTKPALEVGEDVLIALAAALKATTPAPPPAPTLVLVPACDEAPGAAKPGVLAALALLLAGTIGLSACQSAPDQKQALYAVESAYVLIANDEAAAINAGAVPPGAAEVMRATDTNFYAALVVWRGSVEAGNSAAAGAIAGVQTGLQGLVNQLGTANALSPTALAAADAALSLTAALIAGG